MGRKQFARPIGKRTSGLYLRFFFNLPEEKVAELIDAYRLDNTILRTVVYNYEIPENPVTLDLQQVIIGFGWSNLMASLTKFF